MYSLARRSALRAPLACARLAARFFNALFPVRKKKRKKPRIADSQLALVRLFFARFFRSLLLSLVLFAHTE